MSLHEPVHAAGVDPAAAARVAALLEARTGQVLGTNRAWRIETALAPLAAVHGAASVADLIVAAVERDDAGLADRIVDALVNQETSFFRDTALFDAMVEAIASLSDRPRIWSAGCSTGQEPLSLAIAFNERGAGVPDILASDVSEAALRRARAGRFTQFEIQRGLPIRRMMRWFGGGGEGGDWIADPALLRGIAFRHHNLVADPVPAGRFDAILCRNVLFYFRPETQSLVLDRFADALLPGGILVLGAGETVIGRTERFVPSTRFRGVYEATPAARSPVYN